MAGNPSQQRPTEPNTSVGGGTKWLVCCISVPLLVLIAILAFPIWFMEAPAVPYSTIEAMKEGMSRTDVQSLLGEPNSIHTETDGSERWVYHRHTWAMYFVYLSPEGSVTRFAHDF